MSIAEKYKRWRHSRGYGVHSPFGYEIVKQVLHPGNYAWYGYRDISNATVGSTRLTERRSRLLLRLASHLNVQSAYIPNNAHPAYITALKCANSRVRLEHKRTEIKNVDLICTSDNELDIQYIMEYIGRASGAVAIINPGASLHETVFTAMKEGVMFYSPAGILAICRRGMQKVSYSINF
ncbi:MAG: hypothetical protein NC204_01620 [Candidatus Amulumruptor caecigallinarius]|nr:hypothetical protein [Candidatus Amulumruptor caecigallinarius]